MRKLYAFGLLVLGLIVLITTGHIAAPLSTVQAALTGAPASANYQIASDVLAGASGSSSSTHYGLDDSIGQPGALGSAQSANYEIWPGRWYLTLGPTAVTLSFFSAKSSVVAQMGQAFPHPWVLAAAVGLVTLIGLGVMLARRQHINLS